MRIALLGYGKMGKEIEAIAESRGHQIVAKLDSDNDWVASADDLNSADLAIEFSIPNSVVNNIFKCFDGDLPVVVGTTGWAGQLDHVKQVCMEHNKTLFYASNFSIGVNLFFELNRKLAKMMNDHEEYDVRIDETHHIHKVDSPSGTAIHLAEGVLGEIGRKDIWLGQEAKESYQLEVKSHRVEETPGTHSVIYSSDIDEIEIKHVAHHRKGFAQGAILAAEWVKDRKGIFTMTDLLKDVNFAGFWQ